MEIKDNNVRIGYVTSWRFVPVVAGSTAEVTCSNPILAYVIFSGHTK